jgi:type IV secretion system protein VirB10
LQDGVDRHWGTLIGSGGAQRHCSAWAWKRDWAIIRQPCSSPLASGAGIGFNQIGRQLIGRNLNIQPTLTIRPGFPVAGSC